MTTLLLCILLLAANPATQPLPERVDDMVFCEALRARGLNDWLELHLTDLPPADEIELRLRNREKLLAQAVAAAGRPGGVAESISQAAEVLVDLIKNHPAHAGRFRWQLELARDLLERQSPAAFENLLIYELPGQDRAVVAGLSQRAVQVLTTLRSQIEQAWKNVEELDEQPLAELRDSGALSALEELDARSAAMLTWAKLHQALTIHDDRERQRAAFMELLSELDDSGRMDLPGGRELEQAPALLMAAVAERHLGKFDLADGHARQVISLWGRIADKSSRRRLRQTVLIAVLEQIRALRDAGRHDAALQSLEQARQWAATVRDDDPAALAAVSLLEASVVHAKQSEGRPTEANQPATLPWFNCPACWAVLERVSQDSIAHRELLYSILAPAVEDIEPADAKHAVALQFLAGAAVAAKQRPSSSSGRAQALVAQLHGTLSSVQLAPPIQGELRYLLGQLLEMAGAGLDSIHTLTDLAEQMPDHDRSPAALQQALTRAGLELRKTGPAGTPASRAAFVRAARMMRNRAPDAPTTANLTYSIASTLEHDGRYEPAAEEYAAVPADSDLAQQAALGVLRCWRQALELVAASQAAEAGRIADRARDAARMVSDAHLANGTTLADCHHARLLLASAELLNHPSVGGAEQAAQITAEASDRFSHCPDLIGPALRQRIIALKQLKKLAEAREVVDRYLAADAEQAGTTMAGLLQSMHQETEGSLQRGDTGSASAVAGEAVQLGESLLVWAAKHPGRFETADVLVIRLWHAWALLHAGRPEEAILAFQQIDDDAKSSRPDDSGLLLQASLGKADALVETARPTEALSIYSDVLQKTPEHSEPWWHALAGSLACNMSMEASPEQVLQSIKQHRFLVPDLGGGRWQRQITALEASLQAQLATRPVP